MACDYRAEEVVVARPPAAPGITGIVVAGRRMTEVLVYLVERGQEFR